MELRIRERRTPQLLGSVEAFEIDVALIRWPHPPTTLPTRVLGSERLVAVLPRDHPRSRSASVRLCDLRGDPFIMLAEPAEPFYQHVLRLCLQDGFTPDIICTGAEYATACRLAGLGMGVSIVSVMGSRLTVEPPAAFVPIENEDAVSPIVLVARPEDELPVAARAFLRLTLETVGPWLAERGSQPARRRQKGSGPESAGPRV